MAVGWTDEGLGWVAPTSGDPVYRLYNPYVAGGDHHYTLSAAERDGLVAAGWRYEGVGWYSAPAKIGVPLYRQYNPYATTGTHNYTTSKAENDHLISVGWREEGVAWYGIDVSEGPGGGVYEYELRDGVKEIASYRGGDDGEFEIVARGEVPKVGDKVALQPTEENPLGGAGTVTSVSYTAHGTPSVKFEQASDPSEIFESISMSDRGVEVDSSTVIITEDQVSPSSRISVDDTWRPEEGSIGKEFDIPLDDDGSSYVRGGISVSPVVGYDVEWTFLGGLEHCEVSVGGDVEIGAEVCARSEEDVKILEVSAPLFMGFSIDIPLYLHVEADGSISVNVAYEMMTTMRLVDDEWVVEDTSDLDAELKAAVHVRLGAKVGAELKLLQIQLVDAAVGAGVDGSFVATTHETGLTCADLSAFMYVNVEVGTGTDYLVDLGWTFSKDVIDESNSPFKLPPTHLENGVQVPECTYGKDSGEEGPTYVARDVVQDRTVTAYQGSSSWEETREWAYPQFALSDGGSTAVLDQLNSSLRSSFEACLDSQMSMTMEDAMSGAEQTLCCHDTTASIDGSVACVRLDRDLFYGGAHGTRVVGGKFYDLAAGEEMSTYDALEMTEAEIRDAAREGLRVYFSEYTNVYGVDYDDAIDYLFLDDMIAVYRTEDAVVACFVEGVLGPVANGGQEIVIKALTDQVSVGDVIGIY